MRFLVITYYWPPAGGPGVQRWLKTSLALKELGHDVEILTVDPKYATYPVQDDSMLSEASAVKVHTTRARDWFGLYQKLTRRKEVPFSGFANQAGRPGPIQRLSRFIRGNFFLPDPRRGWNSFAIRKASQLISEQTFDVIVTTSPPHSTHLIGLALKQKHQCNWWADFRDPWTDIYYYDQFYPTRWARRIDANLERSVIQTADKVIAVSADLKRMLESKINDGDGKFIEMPNGYDPADFDMNAPAPQNKVFTLVYTGTLSLVYPVEAMYTAIESVLQRGQPLKLQMAGRPAKECVDHLSGLAQQYEHFQFESLGYLAHSESVKLLQNADALLLLIPDLPNNKGILTGKLFEYIGSGRPVWGFGPENGDAQVILNQAQAGQLFDTAEQAAATLTDWMVRKPSGSNPAQREAYTRLGLAANLLAD